MRLALPWGVSCPTRQADQLAGGAGRPRASLPLGGATRDRFKPVRRHLLLRIFSIAFVAVYMHTALTHPLLKTPLLLAVLLLASCKGDGQAYTRVQPWPLPISGSAAQPDLATTPSGELLLSWVQPADGGKHALQLSRMQPHAKADAAAWSAPLQVASGKDWFLNWADTPHVYALQDGSLWAHWLRSTGPGRMDYGIDLVRSGDDGKTWSKPRMVNLENSLGDHGFVTFWQQAKDQLGMAWLDSRQRAAAASLAKGESHQHEASDHDHGGKDAMMLRGALFDAGVQELGEWPLDVSTCDCCTTSSALTDRGVVVVYRGRGANEIRDTRLVRFDGKHWTSPREVHADGWQIAGCPVNGPVVVAKGNTLWVAWYTEASGLPELRAARSDDAGDTFTAPVTIAKGPHVLGRLSLALADGHLLLSWLEQSADETQRLVLGRYDHAWQAPHVVEVAKLAARGRASGMPRLRVAGGKAWLAWTDVASGQPVVRGAMVH